jgi:hypothetical protein
MRTFQEFLDICEELTGERKERAAAIGSDKRRTDDKGMKKKSQARWLTGKGESGLFKDHPSQGFGSHPDPKKSRAPKLQLPITEEVQELKK